MTKSRWGYIEKQPQKHIFELQIEVMYHFNGIANTIDHFFAIASSLWLFKLLISGKIQVAVLVPWSLTQHTALGICFSMKSISSYFCPQQQFPSYACIYSRKLLMYMQFHYLEYSHTGKYVQAEEVAFHYQDHAAFFIFTLIRMHMVKRV